MGHYNKAHVGQTLADLTAAGQGNELVRGNGYGGDASLFNIALVNYQPRGAASSIALGSDNQVRLQVGYDLGDARGVAFGGGNGVDDPHSVTVKFI